MKIKAEVVIKPDRILPGANNNNIDSSNNKQTFIQVSEKTNLREKLTNF
jgi:hypothetical protein